MIGCKITCYADPHECGYCMGNGDQPTAWCTMYDRPCAEVHVDLVKEDGKE